MSDVDGLVIDLGDKDELDIFYGAENVADPIKTDTDISGNREEKLTAIGTSPDDMFIDDVYLPESDITFKAVLSNYLKEREGFFVPYKGMEGFKTKLSAAGIFFTEGKKVGKQVWESKNKLCTSRNFGTNLCTFLKNVLLTVGCGFGFLAACLDTVIRFFTHAASSLHQTTQECRKPKYIATPTVAV